MAHNKSQLQKIKQSGLYNTPGPQSRLESGRLCRKMTRLPDRITRYGQNDVASGVALVSLASFQDDFSYSWRGGCVGKLWWIYCHFILLVNVFFPNPKGHFISALFVCAYQFHLIIEYIRVNLRTPFNSFLAIIVAI